MRITLVRAALLGLTLAMTGPSSWADARDEPSIVVEFEGAALWLSRNDVQIPNDDTGTRFSIVDVTGNGPWAAGRAYLTWNLNHRHGFRALAAPLSIEESGEIPESVDFAGATYVPGEPLEATYQFNSWRLTYRYRFTTRENLRLWVGFSAKIRDAKIELRQNATTSRDTDIGFVPLLHFASDWRLDSRWRLLFDFDGLAGGPGRAFDVALKLGRDFGNHWSVRAGYRTLEGGADVDSVYNFAWLHYAVLSSVLRF